MSKNHYIMAGLAIAAIYYGYKYNQATGAWY